MVILNLLKLHLFCKFVVVFFEPSEQGVHLLNLNWTDTFSLQRLDFFLKFLDSISVKR